jgi:predicted ATP-grasp superfamily ATP-dependent carboligase
LPVPQTRVVELDATYDIDDVVYPVIVKPVRRDRAWNTAFPEKAVLVERREGLRRLLDALTATQRRVLVQQAIAGPETRIESYHAYIDANGDVAAEFTGRKLRTFPPSGGFSTAVVTTADGDVARTGREVLEKLQLRGVAKVDFKRDPDGRLWLLEINPRFNLWHRVGAVAGANIPGAVWADLMGLPRPPRVAARPGVTWCDVTSDWPAARADGVGALAWLRWLARRETLSVLDLTDPKPLAVKGASVVLDRARHLLSAQRRGG